MCSGRQQNANGKNDVPENIRAEYVFLKDYSTKTIERRNSIISMLLVFAATLLGGAMAYPTTPSIALAFPPIALFLAIDWIGAYEINIVINKYILHCLAKKMPGIGWDVYFSTWRQNEDKKNWFPMLRKFSRIAIVFPISQVIAIYIVTINNYTNVRDGNVLVPILLDIVCLVITCNETKKALFNSDRNIILWELAKHGGKLKKTELEKLWLWRKSEWPIKNIRRRFFASLLNRKPTKEELKKSNEQELSKLSAILLELKTEELIKEENDNIIYIQ